MGLCPQCGQGAREVFRRPNARGAAPECFACRRCLRAQGVRHKSENERGTIAERLRQVPALLGEAIEAASDYAQDVQSGTMPDQRKFLFAMGIFNAAADQSPDDETTLAKAQAQIVADDLGRTTRLVDHLEKMIFEGVENHVNRKGEASVTPMRPDSLAKLGNLYLGALNVRANRAGIATSISESHATENAGSVGDMFTKALRDINAKTAQGYSFADVLDGRQLATPDDIHDEPGEIVYKSRAQVDDNQAEIIEGECLDEGQN